MLKSGSVKLLFFVFDYSKKEGLCGVLNIRSYKAFQAVRKDCWGV
ncbi:hypothetical protein M23134_01485 [Microscilla marina ATCC 23134]|uniref:Uncharacterized protein n=1 Tax=Microscilla marina ATCC 23134 TaxID=313606 RepID=A1ZJX2_MICM2|nr:hypothetical protein M23134_01485 [Microscilla marina ATCC 23134]